MPAFSLPAKHEPVLAKTCIPVIFLVCLRRLHRYHSHITMFKQFLAFTFLTLSVSTSAAEAERCTGISAAGAQQWRPFAYTEKQPRPVAKGIAFDIVREIAQRLNLKLEIVTGVPWKRIERQLASGDIDLLAGNYWTQERSEKWLISRAITSESVHLFTLAGKRFNFESLDDLHTKRGVVPRGISLGEDFDEIRPDLDIFEVNRHEQMYEMLHMSRVDYLVSPRFAATLYMQRPENQDVVMLPTPINKYSVHLSMSRKSNCVETMTDINDAIEQLHYDGTIEQIIYRYTHDPAKL